MKDANIDTLAQLLIGNKHVNPVFRGAVASALMKVGEEMAAQKIMEDDYEAQC